MKAWQYEYEKRNKARPVNLEDAEEGWSGFAEMMEARDQLLKVFWDSKVPGSKAPEALYIEMIQAWSNRGYDVSEAEKYIEDGLKALRDGNMRELEIISSRIMRELNRAEKIPGHSYWNFENPDNWEDIRSSMTAGNDYNLEEDLASDEYNYDQNILSDKILKGWQAQIVGGAYGTALEGYTGEALNNYYGDKLNYYVAEPETYNDDITFEIAFLKAMRENKVDLKAEHIADKWLELIPFAWSAEYFALENLKRGIYPPDSGNFNNYFSEWIGAQMRTMVCGFAAPGQPLKAAYYAYLDSSVSHSKNGIYGGIHSAVMTSLAFELENAREIIKESMKFIPKNSEFYYYLELTLNRCKEMDTAEAAWNNIKEEFKKYNWIHTYPNMAAVVIALYFSGDKIDRAFRILADCGYDVDCNAGEVGSILGILDNHELGNKWLEPIGGILNTYLPGYEEIKISELVEWTLDII